jgi:phosphoenolpyruvate carboxykinase (ATP)
MENILKPSVAAVPSNIFFLTADAFGVFPIISRLTAAQAMYYFISGYTAKVAGTENGIFESKPTSSACFGAPFMHLHPTVYAGMLGERIKKHHVKVWLINTGWNGGIYAKGKRIPLVITRAVVSAVLDNKLDNVIFSTHPVLGLKIPSSCPGVMSELLNPEFTWDKKDEYMKTAIMLARYFNTNFKKYKSFVTDEILSAAPRAKKMSV